VPNGRIARVQVPSVRKASVQVPGLPKVSALAHSGPKASVPASNDLRLRSVPMGSARVLSVLRRRGRRRRSGLLLPAQALSGVRLPASSHVQPARVSVCASAVAVRS